MPSSPVAGDISLEALRRRDAAALKRLVELHTPVLLRGAVAMGFALNDAEELVQDAFVSFLEGLDRFEGRSSARTFLFGILYHKASELWRRRTREAAHEDIEAVFDARFDAAGHWLAQAPQGPESAALSGELARIIKTCAGRLPQNQRLAFFLKEAEGAGSEDICNILAVSDTNLRVLLFRARLKLRDCLEKSWGNR